MIAFRKKTRSDEVVPAFEFKRGLVVWVEGLDGCRRECVCTGRHGECLPVADYLKYKERIAAENRARHLF